GGAGGWGPGPRGGLSRRCGLSSRLATRAEQPPGTGRRRGVGGGVGAPRESLAEAFDRLEPVPAEELQRRLEQISLELVLTAHPTEATRRTFLRAHVRISELLARHDDPDLTPREREELNEQLAEEITILWQTDEGRHDPPRG